MTCDVALLRAVGAHRVLVVDDDPDIRSLLVSVLTDDGYEAASAANGRDALAVLDTWDADLIVLDLMMPVMDGWAFASRLHERRSVPILVLSAGTDLTRHAKTIGAADFVPKPFDLDTLLPRIDRLVGANGGATAS